MPSELQTAFPASQLQRERTQTVIPAKNRKSKKNLKSVIPAQAGIQSVRFPFFFFEFQVTSKPPFPQKRESRNSKLQEFIKND
ncbi:hypothetical protein ACNF3S_05820 [Neisseria meningitidis]|uniref:hypothetical protein n=1 Tax=Neisseria meningitidis TaxID=487 RepID=UPI003A7FD358